MDPSNATPLPPSSPAATPAAPASANASAAAAHKTGEDFEAFFLSQVFENMFSGVNADPMFGGGQGETVYRSLLLQEYSKVAARSGGVGIADAVQREILRAQETK
ncbi:MAG TPA: rod-binding protein [Stellaceae bacterium]|nr:rod-binding protein [Stellaceae bacterium]